VGGTFPPQTPTVEVSHHRNTRGKFRCWADPGRREARDKEGRRKDAGRDSNERIRIDGRAWDTDVVYTVGRATRGSFYSCTGEDPAMEPTQPLSLGGVPGERLEIQRREHANHPAPLPPGERVRKKNAAQEQRNALSGCHHRRKQ